MNEHLEQSTPPHGAPLGPAVTSKAPRPTADEQGFHRLFQAQAARVPHRTAVVCRDVALTYAELDAAANRLAHVLRRAGVGPGRCVALCVERSVDMIVGLLGILKAGGAYVPLLADSPKQRLAHQLAETRAPVIVTQAKLLRALPETSAQIVCLDRDRDLLARESDAAPEDLTSPRDLVYVIYTSGSTGVPKGVAVRHENVLNYTRFIGDKVDVARFDDQGGLSWATVSTLAADLGNTSIFPALAFGGTLHVIDQEMALDGDLFGAYAAEHPIDVLKITPSHLNALLAAERGDHVLPRRILFTGGEASTWTLVDRIRAAAPHLRWINHYGPTETTIGSLTFDLDEADRVRGVAATVPIGRPIADTHVYVLDEGGAPVKEGEPGELHIGGSGVTSGYLEQPERTAERFLPDPSSGAPGAKMYRTGDRVRVLPGGAIEFLGRVDFQVKIRGYRVELGEIEAVLRAHPGLREVVVVAREVRPQDLRIVAYFVPSAGAPKADELRRMVRDQLPDHMVPSAFVALASLPLNPNGKVDRKALPEPELSSSAEPEPAGFKGDMATETLEEQIAEIWRALLGVRSVGLDDGFFDIGGHSLAAIHMLAEVHKRTGKRLPNSILFQTATIRGMAEALRKTGAAPLFRSLVPIQPKGKRPPLFCVHGGGGQVYWYKALAQRLGDDQPFYGLQCRIEDDGRVRTNTVEDMTRYYLDEIRAAFPKGPYYLSGASFGGKVAFEIAQRLRAQGETVALLAMFDTFGPDYPRRRPGISPLRVKAEGLYQRLDHHLGALWMLDQSQRVQYVREKLHYGYHENLDRLEGYALAVARWTYVKRGRADSIPADLLPSPGFIKLASDSYKPAPYDGDVIIYRSKLQPPGAEYDEALGWGPYVRGAITVVELPGMHATMVLEPRVRFLVDALRPVLEEAQARHG